MRLPGYCEHCHKVKQVRVTGPISYGGIVFGICAQCEDERERRFKE